MLFITKEHALSDVGKSACGIQKSSVGSYFHNFHS